MPRSKKFVLAALLAGIVLIVSGLAAASYFLGKDMSNKDTSAAVDDTTASEESSSEWNLTYPKCERQGKLSYCFPDFMVSGDRQLFSFGYNYEEGPIPTWEIKVCNRTYSFNQWYVEINHKATDKNCTVSAKVFPNTEKEQSVAKTYRPITRVKTFNMPEIQYTKPLSTASQGNPVSTDLTKVVSKLKLSDLTKVQVIWRTRYTSDTCRSYASIDPSDKLKMLGAMFPVEPGKCTIKYEATIVSCPDCAPKDQIAYRGNSVIKLNVVDNDVDPSYTPGPSLAPSPTLSGPTPTVAVMVSPTPTVVGMAAIKLEPAYKYIAPGAQEVISIVSNTTVQNVSALQIRLTLTGATVLDGSYKTSSEEGYLSLPACSNRLYTNPTEICVDVAKINPGGTGYIQTGDLIGQFTITPDANVVYSRIQTGSENAYMISDYQLVYSGNVNLGTYVTNPAVTPVP